MATIGGATALNLQQEIGSLEVGKKADLIAVSMDRLDMVPLHRPYESLVYSALAGAVETVIVDGGVVMDKGRVLTLDAGAVMEEAGAAAPRMAMNAGIADSTRGR